MVLCPQVVIGASEGEVKKGEVVDFWMPNPKMGLFLLWDEQEPR